jgi:hypothetical protein
VLSPGFDLVTVTGDGLSLTGYASLGADEIECDLLRAFAISHISCIVEDVETVDAFFKAIIEYLYVAPAKVRQVSDLIEARKTGGNAEG